MSELALRFQELTDLLAPLQYAELKKIAGNLLRKNVTKGS
jgi:hypothetical protein